MLVFLFCLLVCLYSRYLVNIEIMVINKGDKIFIFLVIFDESVEKLELFIVFVVYKRLVYIGGM